MNRKNYKKLIKSILFMSILSLLFLGATKVLERKTINGSWNYTAKMNEFYSMPEESIDIVGLGSSHMYSTLNPLEMWKHNQLTSFSMATQRQPLNASKYYLKEVFKTQSPAVVIVEGYMAFEESQFTEEAVAYDAIDPLNFSYNKLSLINEIVPKDQRGNYYFNILKYHSRWRDVKARDFRPSYWNKEDYFKGHVFLDTSQEVSISEQEYDSIPVQTIPEVPKTALEEIYQLTVENDAELMLLIAPYVHSDNNLSGIMKATSEWAREKNINVVDINTLYSELDIKGETDFYDASHLNTLGANKVSRFLGDYIANEYNLSPNANADQSKWENDYEKYYNRFIEVKY